MDSWERWKHDTANRLYNTKKYLRKLRPNATASEKRRRLIYTAQKNSEGYFVKSYCSEEQFSDMEFERLFTQSV